MLKMTCIALAQFFLPFFSSMIPTCAHTCCYYHHVVSHSMTTTGNTAGYLVYNSFKAPHGSLTNNFPPQKITNSLFMI